MREFNAIKAVLRTEFDMKEIGFTKRILGMDNVRYRKNHKLFLFQMSYLKKVCTSLTCRFLRLCQHHWETHIKLSNVQSPVTEEEIHDMKGVPYSNGVGSIMYVVVCSRSDLAFAISSVSRYMANPGRLH